MKNAVSEYKFIQTEICTLALLIKTKKMGKEFSFGLTFQKFLVRKPLRFSSNTTKVAGGAGYQMEMVNTTNQMVI
jgi:hypothetical protein